jgi:uncharacterized protein YukE
LSARSSDKAASAVDLDLVHQEVRAVQRSLDNMQREIRTLQQRVDRHDTYKADVDKLAAQFTELSEHVHDLMLQVTKVARS